MTRLGDPCAQVGAYIHDGRRLYEVVGVEKVAKPMRVPQDWVIVEDVSTGEVVRFELQAIKARMTLARSGGER